MRIVNIMKGTNFKFVVHTSKGELFNQTCSLIEASCTRPENETDLLALLSDVFLENFLLSF